MRLSNCRAAALLAVTAALAGVGPNRAILTQDDQPEALVAAIR